MNITFCGRSNKNMNDCWNDALAFALEGTYTYEEIRKIMEPFMNENGSLDDGAIQSLLLRNGYRKHTSTEPDTMYQALSIYNSHDNDMVITVKDHMVYVSKNVIHDNVKDGMEWECFGTFVEAVYLRPRAEEKQKEGEAK